MLNLKNQVSQQNLSKPQQCGRGKIIKAIAAMQLMLKKNQKPENTSDKNKQAIREDKIGEETAKEVELVKLS